MNIEYIKNNAKFEILTNKHDLSRFDCGSDDLNNFLKNDALIEQENKFNVTHLITCDDKIIGFFTLLSDNVNMKRLDKQEIKKFETKEKYKKIPSIKIGRLAIDSKYSGKGIGSYMLFNIILNLQELSQKEIGIRFITVDDYAKAYYFYRNNKFKVFKTHEDDIIKIDKIIEKDPEKLISMYHDLKLISESDDSFH